MRENIMTQTYPANIYPTTNQIRREERLKDYLQSLREECIAFIGEDKILRYSYAVWLVLKNNVYLHNKILEVPDCCPSSYDFHIMFTWTKDEHYLECKIFNSSETRSENNGDIEFFYRNRIIPSEGWGEDYTVGQTLSDELIDKLSLFVE